MYFQRMLQWARSLCQRMRLDDPLDHYHGAGSVPDLLGPPVEPLDLVALGDEVLVLADLDCSWIRRRTENLECLNAWTFRRTTVLDIDIPPDRLAEMPRFRGGYLLPLKALKRASDLVISVTDEQGKSLPYLTRSEERLVVAAGMLANLDSTFSLRKASLKDTIQAAATALGSDDPETVKLVSTDPDWRISSPAYQDRWLVIVHIQADAESAEGLVRRVTVSHPEGHRGSSKNYDQSRWLRWLDRRRRAAKAREEDWAASEIGTRPFLLRKIFRWFLIRGSLRDVYTVDYDVQQLTRCRSFHVEFLCPPLTYAHQSSIKGRVFDETEGIIEIDRPQKDPYPDRAHIYIDVPESWVEVVETTSFSTELRPVTAGGTRSGLLVSWLITILLVWMTLSILGPLAGVHPKWTVDVNPNIEALVTMLLVGPTLMVALVIRQGEHVFTKSVLHRFRQRIILQGVAAFALAGLLALGIEGNALLGPLLLIMFASMLLTGLTQSSYYASWAWLKHSSNPADENGTNG